MTAAALQGVDVDGVLSVDRAWVRISAACVTDVAASLGARGGNIALSDVLGKHRGVDHGHPDETADDNG